MIRCSTTRSTRNTSHEPTPTRTWTHCVLGEVTNNGTTAATRIDRFRRSCQRWRALRCSTVNSATVIAVGFAVSAAFAAVRRLPGGRDQRKRFATGS
jgi:adenylosuccinate lyase